jgi:microcystin-dependent protein
MPATPIFGLRYPATTDTPDVVRDIHNLASDVETALGPGTAPPSGIQPGECEVWDGTKWARSTITKLGVQSLVGYPSDASKVLDGLGGWRTPTAYVAATVSAANTDLAWPAGNPTDSLIFGVTTAGGSLRSIMPPAAGLGQQVTILNAAASGTVSVLHQGPAGAPAGSAKFSTRTLATCVLQSHEAATYEWDGTNWTEIGRSRRLLNEDVSPSAAIVYSKLALAASIVDSDIAPGAAIAYAKLALAASIVNGDISPAAAIAISKLAGYPSDGTKMLAGDGTWKTPASGVPAGALFPFAGAAVPAGFLLCDGSLVSRSTYAALFAALGTAYGAGDGSTTFGLPNMQGRVPVGKDAGTFATLGATGGEQAHTLSLAEIAAHTHVFTGAALAAHTHVFDGALLPQHNHYMTDAAGAGIDFAWHDGFTGGGSIKGVCDIDQVTGASGPPGHALHNESVFTSTWIEPDPLGEDGFGGAVHGTNEPISAGTPAGTNASQGGGGAHNNLQPYQVVNYIVKT